MSHAIRRPTRVATHLAAFSTMLAHDADAGKLNQRDLQLLALLCAHENPLSVGQMATMIGLSSSHAGRVVDKLTLRGFVTRGRDTANDRRVVMVEPTAAGRALDARVRQHFERSALEEA